MPIRIFSFPRDAAKEALLQTELGIPSAVAAILVRRGYVDPTDADRFLNPKMDQLGDPRLLPDYAKARDEILLARESKQLIFVHGDYDVDGVTSASLFARFLDKIGCNVFAHVPHRMKEGYGIHLSAVEKAKEMGAKLFLTCDCGIGAHEQVEAALEAGMRVVVTDHHLVGDTLPKAHAIVNPHRSDSLYPFKELCGAGVVFRLCEGIARELDLPVNKYHDNFLDLAVLGTVADVMPLTGENRIITKFGLKSLASTKKKGLIALKNVADLGEKDKLKAGNIGFQLGPRLNATGRIDDAARALKLLMTQDEGEARSLAKEIDDINKDRKDRQKEMVDEAIAYVETLDIQSLFAIVVGSDQWHPGIIGLVAGRLVEKFGRPSFAMSYDTETGDLRCSARSIPGFHLGDAIRAHAHLLSGGGHAMAAGFGARLQDAEQIAESLNAYAGSKLTSEDFEPIIEVDAEVLEKELTLKEVIAMEALEPYGQANPAPTFCVRDCILHELVPCRNESLKARISSPEGGTVTGFYHRETPEWFDPRIAVDAIFKVDINDWNGVISPQWKIQHLQPSAAQ